MSHPYRLLKTTISSALAALIVVTSLAMSFGQMRAAAVGEMVLCTGFGPRIVQVDAEGQPVQHSVTCPDTLLDTANLAADIPIVVSRSVLVALDGARVIAAPVIVKLHGTAHGPRAPPIFA